LTALLLFLLVLCAGWCHCAECSFANSFGAPTTQCGGGGSGSFGAPSGGCFNTPGGWRQCL